MSYPQSGDRIVTIDSVSYLTLCIMLLLPVLFYSFLTTRVHCPCHCLANLVGLAVYADNSITGTDHGYWHCVHRLWSRVYETVRCPSIHPSVAAWPTAANALLQVSCCGHGGQEIPTSHWSSDCSG